MGRVIVEQIVSADGYAARPDGDISWFVDADFSETEDDQLRMLAQVEAIVLGATTYRLFAGYWPGADETTERIAGPINTLPKHVVSTTLDEAPWGTFAPAVVERDDGAQVVAELSRRYDGDLVLWGSLTLADALFAAGLVDVLCLRIVPVLIGAGRPVAPAVPGDTRWNCAPSSRSPTVTSARSTSSAVAEPGPRAILLRRRSPRSGSTGCRAGPVLAPAARSAARPPFPTTPGTSSAPSQTRTDTRRDMVQLIPGL